MTIAQTKNRTAIAHVRDFAFMASSLARRSLPFIFGWFEAREVRQDKECSCDRVSNGRATNDKQRQGTDIVGGGVMTENFFRGRLFSCWTSERKAR
jgi:hypothetical protein